MSTLHIFRGLPGSGKTFVAKGLAQRMIGNGENVVRIERDDLRMELLGSYWTGVREDEDKVTKAQHERIKGALRLGFDVISSDTNLVDRNLRELLKLAHLTNSEVEWHDLRHVSLDLCIERDAERDRTVGEAVIRDKYERYIKGRKYGVHPTYEAKDTKRSKDFDFDSVPDYVAPEYGDLTFLFDIDGTLANHFGIRSPYDTSKYRDDTVHEDVVAVLCALHDAGYLIHIFSGRHVDYKEDLEHWLDKHDIPYDRIVMRERESISDDIEKLHLFEKYYRNDPSHRVIGVFDDRNRVVQNTWRKALGMRCYHVADGDF